MLVRSVVGQVVHKSFLYNNSTVIELTSMEENPRYAYRRTINLRRLVYNLILIQGKFTSRSPSIRGLPEAQQASFPLHSEFQLGILRVLKVNLPLFIERLHGILHPRKTNDYEGNLCPTLI